MHQKVCMIDQKVTKNQMRLMAGSNNPYAFTDTFGPGVMVTKVGAVAYVHQCSLVEAMKRRFTNCSEEVPITVVGSNRKVFMDPITKIIKDVGTVVPCSLVMQRKFKLGEKWYCQVPPNLIECDDPDNLQSSFGKTDFTIDFSGMENDMYSPEEKLSHKKYMVIITNI